jgi:hypothetical protein
MPESKEFCELLTEPKDEPDFDSISALWPLPASEAQTLNDPLLSPTSEFSGTGISIDGSTLLKEILRQQQLEKIQAALSSIPALDPLLLVQQDTTTTAALSHPDLVAYLLSSAAPATSFPHNMATLLRPSQVQIDSASLRAAQITQQSANEHRAIENLEALQRLEQLNNICATTFQNLLSTFLGQQSNNNGGHL